MSALTFVIISEIIISEIFRAGFKILRMNLWFLTIFVITKYHFFPCLESNWLQVMFSKMPEGSRHIFSEIIFLRRS